MRILFISNMYPPHDIGGYEQWCEETAVRLIARGHQVSVLTSRYGVDPGNLNDLQGDVIRRLYLQTDLDYYRPIDFFLNRASKEAANQGELRKAIDQLQPDVIMVWGMWNLTHNLPYWAEQWLPDRITYYLASYWPIDEDPHVAYWRLPARRYLTERLKEPIRNFVLKKFQQEKYPPSLQFRNAICCSEYVRDVLVKAGKLPASAGVLYGGIDTEPFLDLINVSNKNIDESMPLRLVYFGRLIEDKGVHTAVEALALLKQQGLADKLELTIIGSGHPEYENRLQVYIAQSRIEDQVQMLPKIPREQIPEWLKKFDVFLFTSIWPEPFGRTIIEAMAAGLVVIGSDVGGSREIFNQGYDESLLFQPDDAAGLAARIQKVVNDKDLRLRLVDAGRQLVMERFTLERMVDEVEAFLEMVLRGSQAS
jgi:glycosyltransferase involved in cell wall biosynthesis